MLELDHLILRVRDARASARFYEEMLGLRHEGHAEPFELLRINAGSTLDLLAAPPRDPAHLAFRLDRPAFERARARLQALGIAYGGGPFERDGRSAPQLGARGWAESIYFHDPDQHNIELRCDEPR